MKKRLMKIGDWREQYFEEGSRPTMKTVRAWIDSGDVAGQRIGSSYYVDVSRWDRDRGNALVNKVLAA